MNATGLKRIIAAFCMLLMLEIYWLNGVQSGKDQALSALASAGTASNTPTRTLKPTGATLTPSPIYPTFTSIPLLPTDNPYPEPILGGITVSIPLYLPLMMK